MMVISKDKILLSLKGMCMGTADIIPGVSGGTMAYILGIYPQLLHAITRINRAWAGKVLRFDLRGAIADIPFGFFIPLGVGIIAALIIFTRIIPIPYYITHYPEPIYGLFFGLIVGSIILLLSRYMKAQLPHMIYLVIGAALGYFVVSIVPTDTPDDAWFVFLCGAVAISAMLLPGISGSFILLVLGKYAYILGALGTLNLAVIMPFVAGCIVGVVSFSHALHWLIRHYYIPTMLTIAGVLLGSLKVIWPFQERIYVVVREKQRLIESHPLAPPMDATLLFPGVMIIIGLALIFALHSLTKQRKLGDPNYS